VSEQSFGLSERITTDMELVLLDVVFIGHVDAGKSTMGGQLLVLTGMVSSPFHPSPTLLDGLTTDTLLSGGPKDS
jgi:translation elongation factor EF-G